MTRISIGLPYAGQIRSTMRSVNGPPTNNIRFNNSKKYQNVRLQIYRYKGNLSYYIGTPATRKSEY